MIVDDDGALRRTWLRFGGLLRGPLMMVLVPVTLLHNDDELVLVVVLILSSEELVEELPGQRETLIIGLFQLYVVIVDSSIGLCSHTDH